MPTTRLDLDQQQRHALATACAYALAIFDKMPGHQVRPGTVEIVADALERLQPTPSERQGRPYLVPAIARNHLGKLLKPEPRSRGDG